MNEFMYLQFLNRWRSIIQENESDEKNLDIINGFPYLEYFENNNVGFAIFNNNKVDNYYFSQNFWDILGVDKLHFEKVGFSAIVEPTSPSHSTYFTLLPQLLKEYSQTLPESMRNDISRTTVGLTFNHKDKGEIRLLIQTYILQLNLSQASTYLLVIYHNVTHMLKDDFYWIRFFNKNESSITSVYHDGFKEVLKHDIITVREKEILRLIIEGKSTDDIAKILFISKATVNNHRQNMLNRVGVKDTTGLISIAKLCKLV
jgi:DNA-binding CsgD family transcriptional regulator